MHWCGNCGPIPVLIICHVYICDANAETLTFMKNEIKTISTWICIEDEYYTNFYRFTKAIKWIPNILERYCSASPKHSAPLQYNKNVTYWFNILVKSNHLSDADFFFFFEQISAQTDKILISSCIPELKGTKPQSPTVSLPKH